ncbi:MAG: tetratricopeptide repeat protein [Desulfovibrionaceae bacterium]
MMHAVRILALAALLTVSFALRSPAQEASTAVPETPAIPDVCHEAQASQDQEEKAKLWAECAEAAPGKDVQGLAHYNRGLALTALDKLQDALGAYNEAQKLLPSDPDVYNNRGWVYLQLGGSSSAEEDFTRALAFAPDEPGILANRAAARVNLDRADEAAQDYERALKGDPDQLQALRGLAFLRCQGDDKAARNGRRGTRAARHLVELERSSSSLSLLAACMAESKHLEEAVRTQEEALALARERGEPTPLLERDLDDWKERLADQEEGGAGSDEAAGDERPAPKDDRENGPPGGQSRPPAPPRE